MIREICIKKQQRNIIKLVKINEHEIKTKQDKRNITARTKTEFSFP